MFITNKCKSGLAIALCRNGSSCGSTHDFINNVIIQVSITIILLCAMMPLHFEAFYFINNVA